jgi:hypothetical protein
MEDRFCEFSFVLVDLILESHISKVSQWSDSTLLAALCARMDAVILNGIVCCISQRFADTCSWYLQGNVHSLHCIVSCLIRKTLIIIHSCSSVWVVDLIAVMYRSWPAGFFFCVYVLDVTTSIETGFASWCVIVYGGDFVLFIWSQIGVVCLCHALLGLIWWEWSLL